MKKKMRPEQAEHFVNTDVAGMMMFNALVFFLEKQGVLDRVNFIEFLQSYVEEKATDAGMLAAANKKIDALKTTAPL